MDENKNRRLRPRRSLDDIVSSEKDTPNFAHDLGEVIVPKRPATPPVPSDEAKTVFAASDSVAEKEDAVPDITEPVTEESVSAEVEPVAEETVSAEVEPAVEETASAEVEPVTEETASAEVEPVVEETASAEVEPVAEETVSAEVEPVTEETVSAEVEPVAEETASAEVEPVTEETASADAEPVAEESDDLAAIETMAEAETPDTSEPDDLDDDIIILPKRTDPVEEVAKNNGFDTAENRVIQPQPTTIQDAVTADSVENVENEKTRLTDVQPKVPLKVQIRKPKREKKESSGTLSGILKAILYITFVLLVSCVLAYYAIQFGNDIFAFVKSDEVVEVVIPKNATVDNIADILGEKGVIKYPWLFTLYAKLMDETGVDENGKSVFIPGTYEVSPMNNYMQLLPFFKERQKPRSVVWVTFPEGATIEEMITILVDDYEISSRDALKKAINEYDYELDFLEGVDELEGRYYRLEGYLFPDTYQFYTDSSAETVVYKMLKNFGDKLQFLSTGEQTYKDRLAELGMTLDEVVTLASMVEKEVKYPTDFDQVSSVFHNRLDDPANFSLLGSDATTVYAILMEMGIKPSALENDEIFFDSPYNTRNAGGMPPGAIANPGFQALYSAFYPADTNYYYFVADSNGENRYATTEAQHEKNKADIKQETESAANQ